MSALQLGLGHPAIVGLEDLETEGLRGSVAWPYALEAMSEVPTATQAVVLRRPEVERDQLVTLSRVLQGSLVRRLDPDSRVLAMQTAGPLPGFGIDRDRIIAIDAFDLQFGKA